MENSNYPNLKLFNKKLFNYIPFDDKLNIKDRLKYSANLAFVDVIAGYIIIKKIGTAIEEGEEYNAKKIAKESYLDAKDIVLERKLFIFKKDK